MAQFPSTTSASGIWTLKKQKRAEQGDNWPPLVVPDPDFEYVTLLLHGDGTNGAQNNTFLDSSTNNFTITRNGNTTQGSFSPYGTLWSNFNPDSNNGIGVATNAALNMGTGDFTVEAWVNTAKLPTTNAFQTSPGGFQGIFGTGPNNSASGSQLYIGVTNLKFDISTDGGGPIDVAHNMVAGQWYHVAISRSGNTFRAFINGALVQTATSSSSWVDGYGVGIMRAEPIGGYGGAWWYGYVSNFRMVKGTAVYTSAFTPSTTPLTAISGTSLLTCQSNRFIDNSSNAFAITINGSPSVQRFSPFSPTAAYSTATIGGSGYFDGNGDFLSTSTSPSTLSGDFTVEAWVYVTSFSTSQAILCVGDDIQSTGVLFFINSTGTLGIFGANGSRFQGTSQTVSLNTWAHVAFVRSSGTFRAYVNGVQDSASSSNATSWSGNYRIGAELYNGSTGVLMNGYISNLRVVTGTAVYTSNFTPPTAPLTAISNTSLLTNFTNAGIFDNAMMNDLETVGNAQISTSVKKFGTGSLAFDGSGDYLSIVDSPQFNLNTGAFTIECWVYNTVLSGYQTLVSKRSAVWEIGLFNNTFYWWVGSTVYTTTLTIPSGVWTHVAVSSDGTNVRLFVGGVLDRTVTGANPGSAASSIYVGGIPSGQFVNGYIDDLRITKGVARYTANFTPPTAAFPDL